MNFVTEDAQYVWFWRANPCGDPILVCFMDKRAIKIKWLQKDMEFSVPGSGWGLRLDALISHGLASSTSTPWTQFLKQGLHDPRLFAWFIRPFLGE